MKNTDHNLVYVKITDTVNFVRQITSIFVDEQLINGIPYMNSQYLILSLNSDLAALCIQSTTLNKFLKPERQRDNPA